MGTFSSFGRRDWQVFVGCIAVGVALIFGLAAVTGWPSLLVIAVVGFVQGGVTVRLLTPAIKRGQER